MIHAAHAFGNPGTCQKKTERGDLTVEKIRVPILDIDREEDKYNNLGSRQSLHKSILCY